MRIQYILLASGFVLTASPAFAQDSAFTGARVEGVVGWDNFSAGSGQSDSKDSVVWGGALGYDYETSGFVIGAELEFTGSGVSVSTNGYSVPGDDLRFEADRDLYVGARAGYAFSPSFLGYAKAGYTNLRVESTYQPADPTIPFTIDSANSDGFRAGAGLEYRFNGGLYMKGEYRYSHYGDVGDYDIDIDRNQVVLGLGFRF